MVLVVLTEPNVSEALIRLIKRGTYLIAPFSIMLIKYFPEMGRRSSEWGGMESGGVTGGKNALGADCFLLGFFLFCHFMKTRNLDKTAERKRELWFTAGLLWMVWWNLIEASSSTSLVALIVGMLSVVVLGRSFVVKRFVGVYVLVGVVLLFLADTFFGVFVGLIGLLGEDTTLTGRTELWQDLLAMNTNPLWGVGFESFWLGDRLKHLWDLHWWKPNEAHNGYLEVYLNLGLVGLGILIALLIATYRKGRRALLEDFEHGRMRLGFLAAVILYNWTEASFRALHIVFLGFYIIALDYPNRDAVAGRTLPKPSTSDSKNRRGLRDSRPPVGRRPKVGLAARTASPAPVGGRRVSINWRARSIGGSRQPSKT
jgi:O-antigen ligase